jgi:hypothetical protein
MKENDLKYKHMLEESEEKNTKLTSERNFLLLEIEQLNNQLSNTAYLHSFSGLI